MSVRRLIVGSRGSKLAVLQAEMVIGRLKKVQPSREFSIKVIKTTGDHQHQADLTEIGGQGVFVKELEVALIKEEIDLAVHSLKDVPTQLGPGLVLAATLEREDVRDAFVSKSGKGLAQLPRGARIGTGSQRRGVQLKAYRPDLVIRSIRGNIDTRLRKGTSEDLDGVVLASAALNRLGWQDRITEHLPTELCLPMVGQGAMTVEIRAADKDTKALVSSINHPRTELCVTGERAFLRALGGGCVAPIAALGTIENGIMRLEGMAASTDGSRMVRSWHRGPAAEAEEIGRVLAKKILDMGARQFLEDVAR